MRRVRPTSPPLILGLVPRPHQRLGVTPPHLILVTAEPVTVPHIAVGLWIATLIVLFVPGNKKLDQGSLWRGYGIASSLFPLV